LIKKIKYENVPLLSAVMPPPPSTPLPLKVGQHPPSVYEGGGAGMEVGAKQEDKWLGGQLGWRRPRFLLC